MIMCVESSFIGLLNNVSNESSNQTLLNSNPSNLLSSSNFLQGERIKLKNTCLVLQCCAPNNSLVHALLVHCMCEWHISLRKFLYAHILTTTPQNISSCGET